jgi:CobQ-like glutamine amidotransferase family enzyme
VQGRVVGTYLHGPALARNPALADMLLSWVVGEVKPLDDAEADDLRRERIGRARSWWQRRVAART